MLYGLLLALTVGGLPVPYVQVLCEAGQEARAAGDQRFWARTLRNFQLRDRVDVMRYCLAYDDGQAAILRRTELPESED